MSDQFSEYFAHTLHQFINHKHESLQSKCSLTRHRALPPKGLLNAHIQFDSLT